MKKIISISVLIILATLAIYFTKPELINNLLVKSEVQSVTVEVASSSLNEYLDVTATNTRKIVWEGLGFEPGFVFKIFSEKEGNLEIFTSNIVTQEGQVLSGVLNFSNAKYTAKLEDMNSKEKSKIEISFTEKACVKPNGDESKHTVNLKIGEQAFVGCADKF